jgi:MscS family membrane protein
MEQAMSILHEINAGHQGTEQDAVVFFSAFGDFAMNIKYIYYITKDAGIADTQSQINLEILKRFNAAGLEFAFPTQTLYNVNS